jgi:molybdopterin molybdotransferase
MITIDEAFSILEQIKPFLKVVEVPLLEAHNKVLAETLYAPISMPPFRQSSMDGFALAMHDALEYAIVGEIKAGDGNLFTLQPGQALKIFTGAAVPDSAQTVVPIEKVRVDATQLLLEETPKPNANIRPIGQQLSKNDSALEQGTLLNPAALGFLAGLGFTSVKVYSFPIIGIVITGNELLQPGQPLTYGKVYESNTMLLQAALHNAHFSDIKLYPVDDDFENTKTTLAKALDENDALLVSGGISVGDYDFVGSALQSLEVETLFYKVNQKPGKPLFAGKKKDKIVFALPGNPAAVLTCFYIYVLPTLRRFSGIETHYQATITAALAHDFRVDNVRAQFLKAILTGDTVTVLSHQDSSMLNSFALANALVYVPDGNYALLKGDKVAVFPI